MQIIRKMFELLEYNKILDMLAEHALSEKAGIRIKKLEPFLAESEVIRHMNETTSARKIMEQLGNPPLSDMNDLEKMLSQPEKGMFLLPEQLGWIAQFLTACRRMKSYLKKAEDSSAEVALYGNSFHDLSFLEDEINRAVRGDRIDDNASSLLAGIRRKIINAEGNIKSKLDSLLRNNRDWFSESFVSIRNGHYTLPVKKEFKNRMNGTVIDMSQSGNTYFIEPSSAAKLQGELAMLHINEENEVRRILYELTALVEENLQSVNINIEAMEILDFVFAKAKMSIDMKAVPVSITCNRKIEIRAGRHPLLNTDTVVPLDFSIGKDNRGVIITGPNTGGKTVALKTIGLLSLMAQSGLHVPAEDGCFTMNNYVLCDIGDGQSITENLSTFSSHMTNIIDILMLADDQSLVLLDELGSGTDPAEGMGLAVAILEELSGKNCLFVATTHYPEIKDFANSAPGMVNARMAFDRQSLMPLYRLEIGEAGESCALYIARRLGFPQRLLERAGAAAYGSRDVKCDAKPRNRKYGYESGSVMNRGISPVAPTYTSLIDTDVSGSPAAKNASAPCSDAAIKKVRCDIAKPGTEGPVRRIKKHDANKPAQPVHGTKFNIGDSVLVYPQKLIGIVYRETDEKGVVGVQVKKKKLLINHKRLKLHVPAGELYPGDYDFSIVFEPVENRKAKRRMEKGHVPGLIIETGNERDR